MQFFIRKMYGNSSQWNKVNEPIYNDYFSGLGICVDGLYGNRIKKTKQHKSNRVVVQKVVQVSDSSGFFLVSC